MPGVTTIRTITEHTATRTAATITGAAAGADTEEGIELTELGEFAELIKIRS
jgi:hypothetical protein